MQKKTPLKEAAFYSEVAERELIISLLIEPYFFDETVGFINSDHFFYPQWRSIFLAMSELYAENQTYSIDSVEQRLQEKGEYFSPAGGWETFAGLINLPKDRDIQEPCRLLNEKWQRRHIHWMSLEINRLNSELVMSPAEIIESIESMIDNLKKQTNNSHLRGMAEVANETFLQIERGDRDRIPTGLKALDDLIIGLPKRGLTIVAAASGTGKTHFACYLLKQFFDNPDSYQYPPVFFTSEMSSEDCIRRLVASMSDVSSYEMTRNSLKPENIERFTQCIGDLQGKVAYLDDTPATRLTISRMRSVLKKITKEHGGVSLVIQDYLQLLGDRTSMNRHGEIGQISWGMKELAKEFNVPFVALAQVKQDVENRADKRPYAGDIRDSGEIRQDSDVIITMYREDKYNEQIRVRSNDSTKLEFIVAKNRNGSEGTAYVEFIPSKGLFLPI